MSEMKISDGTGGAMVLYPDGGHYRRYPDEHFGDYRNPLPKPGSPSYSYDIKEHRDLSAHLACLELFCQVLNVQQDHSVPVNMDTLRQRVDLDSLYIAFLKMHRRMRKGLSQFVLPPLRPRYQAVPGEELFIANPSTEYRDFLIEKVKKAWRKCAWLVPRDEDDWYVVEGLGRIMWCDDWLPEGRTEDGVSSTALSIRKVVEWLSRYDEMATLADLQPQDVRLERRGRILGFCNFAHAQPGQRNRHLYANGIQQEEKYTQGSGGKDYLTSLPIGVMANIMGRLEPTDVVNLMGTCRTTYYMTYGKIAFNELWIELSRLTMPWFEELQVVLDDIKANDYGFPRNRRAYEMFLWGNLVSSPQLGQNLLLPGIANRRRIWELCEGLVDGYEVAVEEGPDTFMARRMIELNVDSDSEDEMEEGYGANTRVAIVEELEDDEGDEEQEDGDSRRAGKRVAFVKEVVEVEEGEIVEEQAATDGGRRNKRQAMVEDADDEDDEEYGGSRKRTKTHHHRG